MDAAEYDGFARFYHRHWASSPYYRQAQAALDHLLFSRLSPGSSVLDLCCGTGIMTAAALKRGFSLTGLDISGGMLRYAIRDLPHAVFLQCDARSFLLPPLFRGAFSTFESMSHISDPAGLAQVFGNVNAALTEGGIFVFDLLDEQAYLSLWDGRHTIRDGNEICILNGGYDRGRRVAWADITIFWKEKVWNRSDSRITEKCHEPEDVARALAGAGFAGIEIFSADRDLGMTGRFGLGRIFLRACKPVQLQFHSEVNGS